MTKKDYVLIAGEIKRGEMLGNAFETKKQIAERLSNALQAENPRFDREKFLSACGVVEDKCIHSECENDGTCKYCGKSAFIDESEA